jgi:protein subunit release factor A
MRDKLEKIIAAYEELEQKMVDPAVVSDPKEYARIAKEHADQAALVAKAREYLQALDDVEAAKEMLHETSDAEEKEMLQADISENEAKLPALEDDVRYMLIPWRSQRREGHHRRDSRGRGWRRGGYLCRRPLQHVPALCAVARLEDRGP